MARNIEIKARLADRAGTAARAAALAGHVGLVLEQDDSFFRCTHGRLKLRCLGDGAELIAYRRDDTTGPKLSHYWRSPVPDPDSMREALSHTLGLAGRVRKQRLLYLVGRTRIHVDRVEGLGDFLELEVVLQDGEALADGEREADQLLQALHVPRSALVAGAYVDLLAAQGSAEAPPAR